MDPHSIPRSPISPAASAELTIPEYLFSPHSTPETITEASNLLASTTKAWHLIHSPPGLQREFKFKTFATAMKFWNAVAGECKVQKHHPEWGNVYNKVVVRWTTHNPRGISSKDIHMAKFCDNTAEDLGEIHLALAADEKNSNKAGMETQKDDCTALGSHNTPENTLEPGGGDSFQESSTVIPYASEIAYPGMPPNQGGAESAFLASLLGTEEQACIPCQTGKENSKAAGTASGKGNTNIKPTDTSPHLKDTEGKSILEEMKRKRDGLDLAEPGSNG